MKTIFRIKSSKLAKLKALEVPSVVDQKRENLLQELDRLPTLAKFYFLSEWNVRVDRKSQIWTQRFLGSLIGTECPGGQYVLDRI